MKLLEDINDTKEQVMAEYMELVPDTFDKTEGSIIYDILSVVAFKHLEQIKLIKTSFKNSFAYFGSGDDLDKKAIEVSIVRTQGIKASTLLTITTNREVFIPHNSIFLCDELEYLAKEDTTITNQGTIEVIASNIGSRFNVLANNITKIKDNINGIQTITNLNNVINGADVETDEHLRERIKIKYKEQATSGNPYHYREWATSVSGIGGAKVFPIWAGAGTVKILLISSIGGLVAPEKIEEVKRYIEEKRPIGATVTVENAKVFNIDINVSLEIEPNISIEIIKKDLKNQINNYLNNINLTSDRLKFGKVASILYNINGILDFTTLKINNGTNSLTIPNDAIAVLRDVVVNV